MNYQKLIEVTQEQLKEVKEYRFERSCIIDQLEPPRKNLIVLKGLRGIGKTTAILQFLSKVNKQSNILYVSAGSTLLEGKSLISIAEEFKTRGGGYLVIDEIHKYPDWQNDVLDIVNFHSKTKLIVSGSSSLKLDHKTADLSRRHLTLTPKGLSFREWADLIFDIKIPKYELSELIVNADTIVYEINMKFKEKHLSIVEQFHCYLKEGYFPTRSNYRTVDQFYESVKNTIIAVIDQDISARFTDITEVSKQNLKRLLAVISTNCPFTPNISKLKEALNTKDDNTIKKYLHILNEGKILNCVYQKNRSYKDFPRPSKIYLENTNFMYALQDNVDIGNVRETFVANLFSDKSRVETPVKGDFIIDRKFTFEIGGKGKTRKQVKTVKDSFVLNDNIDYSKGCHLPLWLIGMID